MLGKRDVKFAEHQLRLFSEAALFSSEVPREHLRPRLYLNHGVWKPFNFEGLIPMEGVRNLWAVARNIEAAGGGLGLSELQTAPSVAVPLRIDLGRGVWVSRVVKCRPAFAFG